eukprot:gnl/MRDRNA2_/MRDRNA2_84870_c2_seq1.p1 gnl/MRDRNA2_/MRDRNA2_84870_c2~~gnl/MRDRNA2_/MRDRNA2_84870_c2_seq1.p1  ORF type:complete len:365 (+),score=40.38 gnl/MRDRNA2_/MRDRNA2_84870_c2_seq1:342-1436(+)
MKSWIVRTICVAPLFSIAVFVVMSIYGSKSASNVLHFVVLRWEDGKAAGKLIKGVKYKKQEKAALKYDGLREYEKGSVSDVLTTLWGKERINSIPVHLKRCALVGSSNYLVGRRLGREIDDHDIVIRVNRLPTPTFIEDFGNKTDVYFSEVTRFRSCAGFMDNFLSFSGKQSPRTDWCNFTGKQPCRYKVFILKGSDFRMPEVFPGDEPGCKLVCSAPDLVCGEQATEIFQVVTWLPRLKQIPTSGLQAFFTFAPICSSMRLYGFGGEGTADHHFSNTKTHNYDLEHEILHRIINASFSDSDWERWHSTEQVMRNRLLNLPATSRRRLPEPTVQNWPKPDGISKWLRWHLVEHARHGALSIFPN